MTLKRILNLLFKQKAESAKINRGEQIASYLRSLKICRNKHFVVQHSHSIMAIHNRGGYNPRYNETVVIRMNLRIAFSKDLVTLFSIEILRELNNAGYSVKYIKPDNVFRDDLLIGYINDKNY